jgi:AcrR family transcriptional regulator
MSATTRARREPAQERSRRTVRHILAAAEELVAEGGVDAATTRAIAERAGVAVPSLYRFFADRDDILDALVEQMLVELEEASQAAEAAWAGGDIGDLLDVEIGVHVTYFQAHPSLAALWFGGRASPAVVESVRRRNAALGARLRELLIGRGLIAADTPPAVSGLMTELGDRIMQLAFRDPAQPDAETLALGRIALVAFLERWAVR